MKNLKIKILSILIAIGLCASGKDVKVVEPEQLMTIGAYYYPEQWSENEWEHDIRNMSELGFEFTHFGEFAWSTMEPKEGKYNFEWLDKAIEFAAKYNLKVILCTPTPTPPVWLTAKHKSMLIVNEDGRTIQHGARQQASWNSAVYRKYVEKIVTVMAKRYNNNPNVWGWQIDNEPSHYRSLDYSENAKIAFRKWLEKKYKSIEQLNQTWGTAFWSQTYTNFKQINIPNQKELVQRANPHAVLDFKRFSADQTAEFVQFQYDLLRKYLKPDVWITTNLMSDYSLVDPLRFKGLDFVTYTRYLVPNSDRKAGDQSFRLGGSTDIGFANDLFRNITGNTGIMELQPGQVNWAVYNPQTMPGAVRMWIYHAFAGDNKFVCTYRFRQPLSGSEQYHYGIMQPDGKSVSASGNEFVQFAKELKELRKQYNPAAKAPDFYMARKTGILYNPDNRWEMEYQPQTNQWDFMKHLLKYYRAIQSFTAPVDVIDETHEFKNYAVLIAPAYQLLDKQLIKRWEEYVRGGGHLVLTCRTAQKNREAHLWNEKLAAPIYPLIGAKYLYFDMLPEYTQAKVVADTKSYSWNNWADIIEPETDTNVWATYSDQFYKGLAGVTHKKLGNGTVTYIGIDSDDGEFEKDMLRKVYEKAGITIDNLPEGLIIQWNHGFWIAMNYSSNEQYVEIPSTSKIIFGNNKLMPAEIAIWK